MNIFSTLCSNLTYKDEKLFVSWATPFDKIKTMVREEKSISNMLEPQKSLSTQLRKANLYSKSSEMLRSLDAFRTLDWLNIEKEILNEFNPNLI